MKYIDIEKDSEKITDAIKDLNSKLSIFSKPEDLPKLSKIIKKNVPFYRRRDFYAYMTYLNLVAGDLNGAKPSFKNDARQSNKKPTNAPQQNRNANVSSNANANADSSQDATTMWMNYSLRGTAAINEFKSYLASKAQIDEKSIVRVSPSKFYSFITFENEAALEKALSALQGEVYNNKVLKVNKKTAKQ